jgi:CheY-like chemotaxis protein
MGGQIWAESQAGCGSTFHLTLPLTVPLEPQVPHPLAPPTLLWGMPVLLVDDNATNRRILQETLTGWHMRPSAAEGGGVALAELKRAAGCGQPYPLVLVDAQMPDVDGFTLIERMKQDPELRQATVMMLSSADLPGDTARCRALGIAVYVVKPVKQSDLLDAVLTALGPRAAAMPDAPALSEAQTPPGRTLHVLLAEDNAVNQRLVVRLLEKRGHVVRVAENGRQVLAALAGTAFDLVLMDVQMPEMDGLETTAAIRAREQDTETHLPIVALTAHVMKGDAERCLAAGMDSYISKPIQTAALFAVIDKVLTASAAAHTGPT